MKRCKILYKNGKEEFVDGADYWQHSEDQINVFCSGRLITVLNHDSVARIGIEDYEPIRDGVICDIHDEIECFDPNYKSGPYRRL